MNKKVLVVDADPQSDVSAGFGDCLPGCPTGAITFEEREASEYDEAAVKEAQMKKEHEKKTAHVHSGCPGSKAMQIQRDAKQKEKQRPTEKPLYRLQNWLVQIKLAPLQVPYFNVAKLLIAADCSAYAYAAMHEDFMKGKVTLIGCPKLDAVGYSEKLMQIITKNDIHSVTIVRMEVSCCGGLEMAAKKALQAGGKFIPWQVVTIGIDGTIRE